MYLIKFDTRKTFVDLMHQIMDEDKVLIALYLEAILVLQYKLKP